MEYIALWLGQYIYDLFEEFRRDKDYNFREWLDLYTHGTGIVIVGLKLIN